MKSASITVGSGFVLESDHGWDSEPQVVQLSAGDAIEVYRVSATRSKPCDAVINTSEGRCHFILNEIGFLHVPKRDALISPDTIVKLAGGTRVPLTAGRGDHSLYVIAASAGLTAQLSCVPGEIRVASLTTDPSLVDTATIYREIADPKTPPLRALGWALALVCGEPRPIVANLGQVPRSLPKSLEALIAEVRRDPAGQWSLREAASKVGYSPFHLSRTFRAAVGYGFPEFVDRCRSEFALNRLLAESDLSIDQAALTSGFGSTQALRDSFRKYLGFLPSELRGG